MISLFVFSFLGIVAKDIAPVDDSNLLVLPTNIAEQDNAFNNFYQAMEIFDKNLSSDFIKRDDERKRIENILSGKEEWNPEFITQIIIKNEQALNYFERGVTKSYFQDPVYGNFKKQPYITDLTDKVTVFNPLSFIGVAELNLIKAKEFYRQGKQKESIDQVFKVLKMGQMMESAQGNLMANLIGRRIKEKGFKILKTIIDDSKNLTKEQLIIYIDEINNFKESKSGLINAFKLEYSSWPAAQKIYDKMFSQRQPESQTISQKLFSPPSSDKIFLSYYYQPNKTKKIAVDYWQASIDNANKNYCKDINPMEAVKVKNLKLETTTDYLKLLFTENAIGKRINDVASVILNSNGLIYQRCAEDFSWASAKLLLAIKLYQMDNGKIITSLNELAPNYISEIPNDPFDGQPIRFLPEKRIIYSVGKDFKDDGGDENNDLVARIEF